MYDNAQLNDLLVTELVDIAEELSIDQPKKLQKQELINAILEKQKSNMKDGADKPKRKRIAKAKDADAAAEPKLQKRKADTEKKTTRKKADEAEPVLEDAAPEELSPVTDENTSIPPAIAQMLREEDAQQGEMAFEPAPPPPPPVKQQHYQRQPPAFNVEFDGVVLGEGVLEMMPDGYGF